MHYGQSVSLSLNASSAKVASLGRPPPPPPSGKIVTASCKCMPSPMAHSMLSLSCCCCTVAHPQGPSSGIYLKGMACAATFSHVVGYTSAKQSVTRGNRQSSTQRHFAPSHTQEVPANFISMQVQGHTTGMPSSSDMRCPVHAHEANNANYIAVLLCTHTACNSSERRCKCISLNGCCTVRKSCTRPRPA